MIKSDYHVHSCFSIDADPSSTLEAVLLRAIDLGLEEIAITDHVDFDAEGHILPGMVDYSEFTSAFDCIKEKYAGRIRVVMGIETSLAPHVIGEFEEMTAKYPFEFILGSSHAIEKIDVDWFPHVFDNKTKRQAYELYFTELLHMLERCNFFSVCGHIDYIKRYGPYDHTLEYKDYKPHIDAILRLLVERGKGLELNTSGYRYGFGQPHPSIDILRAYKRLGGEIITVGSDAHSLDYIGAYFHEAENILREIGFKAYTVFREREPVWVDLEH